MRIRQSRPDPIRADSSDDLALVRRIVFDYLRQWRVKVWLFGSRARGDASSHSDIDIALLSEEESLPVDWLAGLRERLEESNVLCLVDVVELRGASRELKRKVEQEGILWSD
ncbi:MAG: nucleotidyltransferase domain-containing protein [Mariprofundales bacterium]